ncbi:RES family NAD+ phosphorylase [Rhizobium sp. LjRoot254]|uniref:RES family NAD+ phosphorylase n=1 Tax=Rhizobium sp. LjRoot254 TaxID=3342297 RepID=UPI003ECEFF9D
MSRYIWRISAHADLSGRGGLLSDGRWHKQGIPVVYCSDHPATALLEIIVHIDPEEMASTYQVLKIFCPDDLPTYIANEPKNKLDSSDFTRALGSMVLGGGQYCLLDVPSIVMPLARNILINPDHPAADRIRIEEKHLLPFDQRLFKRAP